MPSYRAQIESEIRTLVKEFLDATEERYGTLPQFDVFGLVTAPSYTPDDSEPGAAPR
jgi:hypothetical protein